MDYLEYKSTNLQTENSFEIEELYSKGFLFTRRSKGNLYQTRSLRINLENFELNSENRRILRKTEGLEIEFQRLPLEDYSWTIHSMAKDFYTSKFGEGVMSASKIKELFQNKETSNMNGVFIFSLNNVRIGYCLCYYTENILHYAFPFYDLKMTESNNNIGLGMMLKAILWCKEKGMKYVYLGSVKDNAAKYKLQFKGLEWWDVEIGGWNEDVDGLKRVLG